MMIKNNSLSHFVEEKARERDILPTFTNDDQND